MGDEAEQFLQQLNMEMESEENAQVKKAMQLFTRVDNIMKNLCLQMTGFVGPLSAIRLREHFQNLDLMDMLDDVIWNLEDELARE